MSSRGRGRLTGTVRWAVLPYAPRPPFRIYAGEGQVPIVSPAVDAIIEGMRKRGGDAELTYLVSGKARPVLILNEPPSEHHRDVTALRLLRLPRLGEEQRERVRRGEEQLLLPLPPDRFDLPEENAVMVSALVRLNVDAIGSGPSLGELSEDEFRILGERIIRFYGFDTRLLVERRIRELVAKTKPT